MVARIRKMLAEFTPIYNNDHLGNPEVDRLVGIIKNMTTVNPALRR